ncbi:MAG: hypothetical protein M0027_09275 [Candidatus Dormibacteraeota bacterium]|jgi:hypothetical protein|nr:hypothetical protein [Candidatus Dormibacteraeota bacterium]
MRQTLSGKLKVERIFGLLKQLLPDLQWNDDALGTPVGTEVHRLALSGVEALGNLVEGCTCLTCSNYLGTPI